MSAFGIITIVGILFLAWKYPPVALAMLLQINLIRALAVVDLDHMIFNEYNKSSVAFGLLLPLFSFFLILLRLLLQKKKTIYNFDETSYFIIALSFAIIIGCFYAPKVSEAIDYAARFILIGVSYFFITKIHMINSKDFQKEVERFFLTTYWLGIFLGTVALVLVQYSEQSVLRLTIPGVHPNSFVLLIGITTVISFVLFYTDGAALCVKKRAFLNYNNFFLVYIVLLLFATNSRGVLLATVIAISFYIALNVIKINRTRFLLISLAVICIITYAACLIDIDVLFYRLLNSQNDQSIGDRFIAYQDSLNIFYSNPFGVGTSGFKYYSILEYPHNILLENIAVFGILGVLIDLYLVFLVFFLIYKSSLIRKASPHTILLLSIFIYFLVETMFSFTLWMHKGLYLSLALVSINIYHMKTQHIKT